MADRVSIKPTGRPSDLTVRPPGDKSLSHRAILLGLLANGTSHVGGLLASDDIDASFRVLHAYGGEATREGPRVSIRGRGVEGLSEPRGVMDAGNSGTTMRLACGIAALAPGVSVFTGDASLSNRPMGRVLDPLRTLGIESLARAGNYAPLAIRGRTTTGGSVRLAVASAQVKSALLVAGLGAAGPVVVTEPVLTRDHTERLLRAMGAQLVHDGLSVTIQPGSLRPLDWEVPADPSSAAYWWVLAAITRGRASTRAVLLNPTRTGILEVLRRAGATVRSVVEHDVPEASGTVEVQGAESLRAFSIEGSEVPAQVDEIPLAAVLATQCQGVTEISGAAELRVKETDRIVAMVRGLSAMGAEIEERPDGFRINGPTRLHGARVESYGDHRIAMALAIAASVAEGETLVEGAGAVSISYPEFWQVLDETGAVGLSISGSW